MRRSTARTAVQHRTAAARPSTACHLHRPAPTWLEASCASIISCLTEAITDSSLATAAVASCRAARSASTAERAEPRSVCHQGGAAAGREGRASWTQIERMAAQATTQRCAQTHSFRRRPSCATDGRAAAGAPFVQGHPFCSSSSHPHAHLHRRELLPEALLALLQVHPQRAVLGLQIRHLLLDLGRVAPEARGTGARPPHRGLGWGGRKSAAAAW